MTRVRTRHWASYSAATSWRIVTTCSHNVMKASPTERVWLEARSLR